MGDGLVISSDREDTLTRAEYLAARGYDTNGASSGPAPTEAPPDAAGEHTAPNPVRLCAWCGDSLPAGTHGLSRYCGEKCRRAAKRARERPAAAASLPLPAAAVGPSVELGSPMAPAPVSPPGDGVAALVVELLARGAGDVEVTSPGGWRLTAHPRG